MKVAVAALLLAALGCQIEAAEPAVSPTATTDGLATLTPEDSLIRDRLAQYATVRLEADLSGLSDSTRRALPHLIAAVRAMDGVFWQQAYGDRDSLLTGLSEPAQRYARVNYGPWDRLDGDVPFLPSVGPKPAGANLYPPDLTREELLRVADLYPDRGLTGRYTLVRRTERGGLEGVPYHVAFADAHGRAAAHLRRAADLSADSAFARALRLRADALGTDDYRESDRAWTDVRDSPLDVVVGPVETYEDGLGGVKAAHGGYVLVKDPEWSRRLRRYAALLPALQRGLPVDSVYKAEQPKADVELGVYDVVYVAGEANAGPKAVSVDLPNDEAVRGEEGSRRLQLRNAMRAKFERTLLPITDVLIAEDQRDLVTFDAFFGNAVFHEVAHGLGVRNTVGGAGTVREALGDRADAVGEATADVLGLYLAERLVERGEWDGATLDEHYVTFVASVFRTVRFGAAGARGRANLVRFNVLRERGAVVPEATPEGEFWRVVPERMGPAVEALARRLLTLQGDGDYDVADRFVRQYGRVSAPLASSLARVAAAGVPVDVVYEQGPAVLGLDPAPPVRRAGPVGQ